ncbi:MAG: DUF3426 domain-containing protein [Pseudomonadota bacterium]
MALATKCPHCNTIFRVAHDQLKLRGGIVRCGACNEVFDGNATLVEPAPKQPVFIDLPEQAPEPAHASSPELDAIMAALDTRAADMLEPDPVFELDLDDSVAEAETHHAGVPADDDADDASPAADSLAPATLPLEDSFDLDLDVDIETPSDDEAATAPDYPHDNHDEASPAPWETASAAYAPFPDDAPYRPEPGLDDAADDFADPLPDPYLNAAPASSTADPAFDDEATTHHLYDGRREPTLDIPDEHLEAAALDDGFALDDGPDAAAGEAVGPSDAAGRFDAGSEDQATTEADDDDEDIVTLSGAAAVAAAATAAGVAAEPAHEEPGFIKRDRRRQRFGKAARIAMAFSIPLLIAALLAQIVGTFRNPLAATVPAVKPALVSACALAGCTVDLPAQIDYLSIEQGELQTLADNTFSFATALRNQSGTAQSWPHIELILNDSADKPVLRRVFSPREYLASAADIDKGFTPRSEQSVKLYFELARIKASGYHIAVFYP